MYPELVSFDDRDWSSTVEADDRVEKSFGPRSFAEAVADDEDWHAAGYRRDGRGVWWRQTPDSPERFVTREAATFRIIDLDYGHDRQAVYFRGEPVPGADPHSFERLPGSDRFARDRSRLYVNQGAHLFHQGMADTAALIANGTYVTDRHTLWQHYGTLLLANGQRHSARAAAGDMAPLEAERLADWLYRLHPDEIGWWHPDYESQLGEARDLAPGWRCTDRLVLHRTMQVNGYSGAIPVDTVLPDARPETFRALDTDHGTDGDAVWFQHRLLAGADPNHFESLGGLFARDQASVWYNGHRIEGADPDSFTAFATGTPFGKDRSRVYGLEFTRSELPFGPLDHVMVPIEGLEAQTFTVHDALGGWATDGRVVLRHSEVQPGLDAASFRLVGETPSNAYACDCNGLYRSNGALRVVGVDGAAFRPLSADWGSDGKVVFCFATGAILRSADGESFRVTGVGSEAEDRTTRYWLHEGSVKRGRPHAI